MAVGGVIVVGALLTWAHVSQSVPPMPATEVVAGAPPHTIAGVPLSQVITGPEAIRSIQQLHGKEFPLVSGAVATYGDGNIVLWVSGAGDEAAAAELTALMTERIAEGRSPFTEEGTRQVDGFTIYDLSGLGQRHFYWQSGDLVLWLAADEALAEDALKEVVSFYR